MGIKTKTVCVKKQRKQPSKAAAAASEQHDAESGDGEGDILAVREGEGREDRGVVLQKVASELHPKVRNHGEGPY